MLSKNHHRNRSLSQKGKRKRSVICTDYKEEEREGINYSIGRGGNSCNWKLWKWRMTQVCFPQCRTDLWIKGRCQNLTPEKKRMIRTITLARNTVEKDCTFWFPSAIVQVQHTICNWRFPKRDSREKVKHSGRTKNRNTHQCSLHWWNWRRCCSWWRFPWSSGTNSRLRFLIPKENSVNNHC